jgi:hypothetical protein
MFDGVGGTLFQPALVLSIVVGAFHTSAYLVIFGRIGWHTLATLLLAVVGAWVADMLLGPGAVLRLGDYSLLWGSVGAWVAIAAVELPVWYRGRGREGGIASGARTGVDAP